MEYLKICMDNESYELFKLEREKNPFIILAFKYIVPYLFHIDKEVEDKPDPIKSGLQALIDRNKKRVKETEKANYSFEKSIISFMYKLELDYSLVDKITYSYFININKNLKEITKEDNKNKDGNKATTTKSMESVAKKL